jgi:hypothetical protein
MRLLYFTLLIATSASGQPSFQWALKASLTASAQAATDITTDPAGNVFLLAYNSATAQYGAYTAPPGHFVVKYTNSGQVQWVKPVAGNATDLAADRSGYLFVSAGFSGTVNYDNQVYNSAGDEDMLLYKFSPWGSTDWVKHFGGPGTDRCNAISVDSQNNLVIAGETAGMQMDQQLINDTSYVVAKFSHSGSLTWARTAPSNTFLVWGDPFWSHHQNTYAIDIDRSDNIYVLGTFVGYCNYCVSFFIQKHAPNGDTLFRRYKWDIFERPSGLKVDASGNIYLHYNTGSHYTNSRVLVKYSPQLDEQWSADLGSGYSNFTLHNGVALDDNENPVLSGVVGPSGYGTFDSVQMGSSWYKNPSIDVLVAAFRKDSGQVAWSRSAGGRGADGSHSAFYRYGGTCNDVNGNIYISGNFHCADYGFTPVPASDTCIIGNALLQNDGDWQQVFVTKLKLNDRDFPTLTSLNDNRTEKFLTVYPNPCAGTFRIDGISAGTAVEVYSCAGALVYNAISSGDNLQISGLAPGLYSVRAIHDGAHTCGRILVSR